MQDQAAVQQEPRTGRTPWWQRGWIAPLVLALLPAAVFPQAAFMRAVFYAWDIQAYFYPYHLLPAALLKRGELPLWNPFTFSGMPLFADGQTALLHPASWAFFVLPAWMALNFAILLQFSVAGLGMYCLLRRLSLWRLPSFLGAAIYACSGGLAARVVHLSILSGAALLPLAVLCVELTFRALDRGLRCGLSPADKPSGTNAPESATPGRVIRQGPPVDRWFVVAAVVVAIQVFAGHPQVPVYTALALGLYTVIRAFEYWRRSRSVRSLYRMPAVLAGIYVLGFGLAAVQLVPWVGLMTQSTRAAGAGFDLVFGSSMARSDWLLQLFPYAYGSLRTGPFADQPISISLAVRFLEHSAYAGILPLGLSAYAILSLRRRAGLHQEDPAAWYSTAFFGTAAIAGLLLATGWGTPLAHLVYRVPVLGKLRAVERALLLADFAVAGLASLGLQRLVAAVPPTRNARRRGLVPIGAATAALPLLVVLLVPQPWFQRALSLPPETVANLRPDRLNAAVPIAVALASAALLLWWSRRPAARVTQALATVLILLDIGVYAALFNPTTNPHFYDRRPAVLAALSPEPRPYRKATFFRRKDINGSTPVATLGMSWGMVFGVEDINGFNSLQPRRYTDYLSGPDAGDVTYALLEDDALLRFESPILSSLNVRYVLVPAGMPLRAGAGLRRIHADADVVVYENTLAWPRAFFAGSVRGVTDPSEVRRAVTADGFDGRRLALVETDHPPDLPPAAGADRVALTAWDVNRVSLVSDTATPRFLVLSEMYFPGWHATIDGAETTVYRTNYLFRGVVVPAGRHTVAFVYRPLSIVIGAAVSGLSLVIAAALLLTRRRRRG